LTPRPIDNLRVLLEGACPAWIPFSVDVGAIPGFSGPILRKFHHLTGAADPAEHFGADVRLFSLSARFGGRDPAALHGPLPPGRSRPFTRRATRSSATAAVSTNGRGGSAAWSPS